MLHTRAWWGGRHCLPPHPCGSRGGRPASAPAFAAHESLAVPSRCCPAPLGGSAASCDLRFDSSGLYHLDPQSASRCEAQMGFFVGFFVGSSPCLPLACVCMLLPVLSVRPTVLLLQQPTKPAPESKARCCCAPAVAAPRPRPARAAARAPASLLPRLLIEAVAYPAPHSHVSCFAFTHTLPPPSLALGPAAVLAILPVLSRLTPSCARPHTPFLTPSASDGACPGGAQRQLDGAARE